MLTLRSLAIAMAAAEVLAGLPAKSAQACDNDRYPCPVVVQPQEVDAEVRPPQSRKKASRAAPRDEKARAKAEPQSSQAPSQTNPAAQEQAANAASWKGRGAAAAGIGPQAAAGEPNALRGDTTPTVPASAVKMVEPNEVNELDLAAAPTTPAEASWLSSLLATLGAALAAASTVRFLFG